MPHSARKRSASGFYHVVPKGVAGQTLFGNDHDRKKYLEYLAEAKDEFGLRLHAYCLMSNHVHLAVEDKDGKLSEAMKLADERYGSYYAEAIGRNDGVFRKPFWSEPIETDNYLLCAVRYIHANPAAAGICPASVYPWSSVGDYLGRASGSMAPAVQGLTHTGLVLDLLSGRKGFIEWSQANRSTAYAFPGSKLTGHLEEDEAIRIAADILGHDPRSGSSPEEALLLCERGFAMRQVQRLTGISYRQLSRLRQQK